MSANEKMTSAERSELMKLVRMRVKIAKAEIDSAGATQLAHIEEQLSKQFSKYDAAWKELTEELDRRVEEINRELAKRCAQMGVPDQFRPSLSTHWWGRGENAIGERRAELRRMAQTKIDARAQRAKVTLERAGANLIQTIIENGLDTEGAKRFLANMPTVDALLPKLDLKDLEKQFPLLNRGRE